MRSLYILLLVLVLVFIGAVQGPSAMEGIRTPHPLDPLRSHALSSCAMGDPNFLRLSAAERQGCFDRYVPAREIVPAPNFIDLRNSAAHAHGPNSDVAQQQALARYLQNRPATVIR